MALRRGYDQLVFALQRLVRRQAVRRSGSYAMFREAGGAAIGQVQAEHDVLVLGGVHVVAQLVGGEPELGFEANRGGGLFGLGLRVGLVLLMPGRYWLQRGLAMYDDELFRQLCAAVA